MEVLIFGFYDNLMFEMIQWMFIYLDILWGVENVLWLMYYLNGQDNSLVLILILFFKDFIFGFKELIVSDIVDLRCVEML